jgi:hypothetical protein
MSVRRRLQLDRQLFAWLLLNPVLFRLYVFRDEIQRLSPAQRRMVLCTSKRQLVRAGRKTGKTLLNVEGRVLHRLAVDTTPGEGMLVTPREKHMQPVWQRVVTRIHREPLLRLLVPHMNKQERTIGNAFGFTWYFRIEGDTDTGVNMVGLRAREIVGDEMAYGGNQAHAERLQTVLPGGTIVYNGVPNGVRSTPFYRLDQTAEGSGWCRHHLTFRDNPIYADPEAAAQLVRDYGGEATQDFLNQALGEWGMEAAGAFDMERILPHLAHTHYFLAAVSQAQVEEALPHLHRLLPLPPFRAEEYVLGMDVGWGGDPSVIKLAGRPQGASHWVACARIVLVRFTSARLQAEVLHYLNLALGRRIVRMCLDTSGYGRAVADRLLEPDLAPEGYFHRLLHANPGGRTELEIPLPDGKVDRVSFTNKHLMTVELEELLYSGRLRLAAGPDGRPVDRDEWDELATTTRTRTARGDYVYHPARRGEEHITDALRYLARAVTSLGAPFTSAEEEFDPAAVGWVRPFEKSATVAPDWV